VQPGPSAEARGAERQVSDLRAGVSNPANRPRRPSGARLADPRKVDGRLHGRATRRGASIVPRARGAQP